MISNWYFINFDETTIILYYFLRHILRLHCFHIKHLQLHAYFNGIIWKHINISSQSLFYKASVQILIKLYVNMTLYVCMYVCM